MHHQSLKQNLMHATRFSPKKPRIEDRGQRGLLKRDRRFFFFFSFSLCLISYHWGGGVMDEWGKGVDNCVCVLVQNNILRIK